MQTLTLPMTTTKDGWEQPIGLTKEYAIEVIDSDDDDHIDIGASGDFPPASQTILEAENAGAVNDDGDSRLKRKRDDNDDYDGDESTLILQKNMKDTKINPFASYMFEPESSSSPASSLSVLGRRTKHQEVKKSSTLRKTELSNQEIKKKHRQRNDDKRGVVDTKQLIAKWHAFADPNASVEQQRFQILLAARIHARCQEKVVSKTMDRIRTYFDESFPHENGGLTVHTLAGANPESDIAPLLSSILFGNVKAGQIVQAAKDILSKFGGKVPESECSLKDITGIGPKLAQVLAVVNRRCTFST